MSRSCNGGCSGAVTELGRGCNGAVAEGVTEQKAVVAGMCNAHPPDPVTGRRNLIISPIAEHGRVETQP